MTWGIQTWGGFGSTWGAPIDGVTYGQQYRPISTDETSADDGISVAALRQSANNICNAKYILTPNASTAFRPEITSPSSSGEQWISFMPPVQVPAGSTKIVCKVHHKMTNLGTGGSETVTWRIYFGHRLYVGPLAFDDSYLGRYVMASFTSSTASYDIADLEVDITGFGDVFHTTITAEESADEANTSGKVVAIQWWPRIF